jgi:hypothetical protein
MFLSILIGWIINRAQEPSTYAGLGTILAGAPAEIPTDMPSAIKAVAVAVVGLVAIFMKEKARY